MNRLFVPVAVAAVIASSSFAFADQSTGVVKTFNAKAMTLTLKDGTVYHLAQGFKNPGLKAGQKVQITWSMQNGKHDASAVTIQN